MGKYTSLARSFRDVEPLVFSPKGAKERGILNKDIYVYQYNEEKIEKERHPRTERPQKTVTKLRTTNLTNLKPSEKDEKPVTCIHQLTHAACAVCSGYARWLIEDEGRLQRARREPEAVRREYRRSVGLEGDTG